jgi:ATP-dependent Lhr-like helicase
MTMGSSPPLHSDRLASTFDRLHPEIRRWIYQKGWSELREVQAEAIDSILGSEEDVVISAATASGKTEAAFLPILTQTFDDQAAGFRTMYVGPLKALINDQFLRLDDLCLHLNAPVSKWHGDVATSMKQRARERPAGTLLITPESLEALFVRRPESLLRMFSRLSFIVIDELHSFLSTDRGVHLGSLLKRLDQCLGRSPRRIGLSATIGNLNLAAAWLRPDNPAAVRIINVTGDRADLKLQVRGITMPPRRASATKKPAPAAAPAPPPESVALEQISAHLFDIMRAKGNHLVFAARRRDVEAVADTLRMRCEAQRVPNEFFPHHGNLSRDFRETLETRLKDGALPTTAIATSTLELGVDIGAVESVAQIGAPRSVAALRQRLGRSGRRPGRPAVLRMYAIEPEIDEDASLVDRLRLETVLGIATVTLLLERWVEPPNPLQQHLSTLLHQVLALIVQKGGVSPKSAYEQLSGPGPFASVDVATFKELLRGMRATDPPLIEQSADGTLMLGLLGERVTDSYEFYAVFKSPEEYRIICGGRTLGTISLANAFGPEDFVIFSGRRWRVIGVDDRRRTIEVEAAPAGRLPRFEGAEAGALHDIVVARMRDILRDTTEYPFLDQRAARHLSEGRNTFEKKQLGQRCVAVDDDTIFLFPWRGSAALDAVRLALHKFQLSVTSAPSCLMIPAKDADLLQEALRSLSQDTEVDGAELAQFDDNLERAKYDGFIPRDLLRQAAAIDRLQACAVPEICGALASDMVSLER